VKAAGDLEPGAMLEDGVAAESQPLADALTAALADPRLLPDLYSPRDEHATIASVLDEVFLGPAGKAAWQQFVEVVSSFTLRGPLRGALVVDDLARLAANIDIGQPPTPYRFFYGWLREDDGWRIVVSHDAVSRSLG